MTLVENLYQHLVFRYFTSASEVTFISTLHVEKIFLYSNTDVISYKRGLMELNIHHCQFSFGCCFKRTFERALSARLKQRNVSDDGVNLKGSSQKTICCLAEEVHKHYYGRSPDHYKGGKQIVVT